jgi:hypothetical protein
MRTQNAAASLLSEIVQAGATAITDYLEMSGDAMTWDVPEFWLKAEVARSLQVKNQYYIFLERRVSDILSDAQSGSEVPLSLQGERQTGRVDIALYERTPNPVDAGLVSVIEVKKMGNIWCFNSDALRIRDIAQLWSDHICGIIAGLFCCVSEGQAQSLFMETEKRLSEACSAQIKLTHSPIVKDVRGSYSGMAAARVC